MPSLYKGMDFDLSGFSVGVIEGESYPKMMEEGDKIYGIRSSGIHSNGYSLINRILEDNDYDPKIIMEPTKIYVDDVNFLKDKYTHKIKGFSHITGGGLIDNIPRIINEGFNMNINKSWEIPDVFQWIYKHSNMTIKDMLTTYNCGIGMVVIFNKDTEVSDNLIELGEIVQSNNPIIDYQLIQSSFN